MSRLRMNSIIGVINIQIGINYYQRLKHRKYDEISRYTDLEAFLSSITAPTNNVIDT